MTQESYLKNMKLNYDGFKRSKSDYVSIYPTNLNSSESKLIMELGDDYTTSFEILAKMYNKGYSDRVATFRGVGGSEANPADQAGIHFYQNLDMHGYRIWGLNNLSANAHIIIIVNPYPASATIIPKNKR